MPDHEETLAHARKLLRAHPLIDGHNDLPWAIRTSAEAPGDLDAYDLTRPTPGHTDLPRLRAGGVGGQFWSVFVPAELDVGYARAQLEQLELARRMVARYAEDLVLCTTAAEVEAGFAGGRIASMLGMEGGHVLEGSLGTLRAYRALGAAYLTLTHNTNTELGDSATDEAVHGGLSEFGRDVVREVNRLGMLVDCSHAAPSTMADAIDVSTAPIIFSHSSARAICDVPRNVPDEILARLPDNGGICMITFVAGFISQATADVLGPAWDEFRERTVGVQDADALRVLRDEIIEPLDIPLPSVADVADHVEHVARVAGVQHVGIGGDFDGSIVWPVGLEDVSCYPVLFAELIRRGWTDGDLAALAGGNVLRVMRAAEAASR